MKRPWQRGSVLVEGVLCLSLLIFPSVGLNLELIRGAQYQAMLHHMSFLYVRLRVLGHSQSESKREAIRQTSRGLPDREVKHLLKYVDSFIDENRQGMEGVVRFRYPGWFTAWHARFQMTKRCQFSL